MIHGQTLPEFLRPKRMIPEVKVEVTSVGVRLYVAGVQVTTWLGTDYKQEAEELATTLRDALNRPSTSMLDDDATIQFLVDAWPVKTEDGGITLPDGSFIARSLGKCCRCGAQNLADNVDKGYLNRVPCTTCRDEPSPVNRVTVHTPVDGSIELLVAGMKLLQWQKGNMPAAQEVATELREALHKHEQEYPLKRSPPSEDEDEEGTEHEQIASLLIQTISMNGWEAFWDRLKGLPVSKFIGPLKELCLPYNGLTYEDLDDDERARTDALLTEIVEEAMPGATVKDKPPTLLTEDRDMYGARPATPGDEKGTVEVKDKKVVPGSFVDGPGPLVGKLVAARKKVEKLTESEMETARASESSIISRMARTIHKFQKQREEITTLRAELVGQIEMWYEAGHEKRRSYNSLYRALANLEWSYPGGPAQCPACRRYKDEGHLTDCPLAMALTDTKPLIRIDYDPCLQVVHDKLVKAAARYLKSAQNAGYFDGDSELREALGWDKRPFVASEEVQRVRRAAGLLCICDGPTTLDTHAELCPLYVAPFEFPQVDNAVEVVREFVADKVTPAYKHVKPDEEALKDQYGSVIEVLGPPDTPSIDIGSTKCQCDERIPNIVLKQHQESCHAHKRYVELMKEANVVVFDLAKKTTFGHIGPLTTAGEGARNALMGVDPGGHWDIGLDGSVKKVSPHMATSEEFRAELEGKKRLDIMGAKVKGRPPTESEFHKRGTT